MRYGHPDNWSPPEHECYDPSNCEACHKGHDDLNWKWTERIKACLICSDEFDELVKRGEKCCAHPDAYCEAGDDFHVFYCEACEQFKAGAEPRVRPAGDPAILPTPSL